MGPAGTNGTNGINGTNGATGPQGPQGIQGPAGTNGTNGINGTNGAAGAQGPMGPAGTNGATGPMGPAGTNGATGPQGIQGPMGPAGTNGFADAATTNYFCNSINLTNLAAAGIVTLASFPGVTNYSYSGTTTGATQAELFIGGVASNRYAMLSNTVVCYSVLAAAWDTNLLAGSTFRIRGGAQMTTNATCAILDGGNFREQSPSTGTMSTVSCDLVADTTNNAVVLKVTGLVSNTINWRADAQLTR
jgi:hypothetical protein